MKILTTRQPWAHLIVRGLKDIENKKTSTRYRGLVLILAATTVEWVDWDLAFSLGAVPREPQTGGIVGMCDLIDVVEQSNSRWFKGPYGWVLNRPKRLPFTPWKGQLALVDAPAKLLRRLKF